MYKFVADAMLGRLSRWMRYLGYDVLYFRDVDDRELVRKARLEGRILITRDSGIPKRFKVNCYLIRSQSLKQQLREILERFPLSVDRGKRCMGCNESLRKISKKEDIKDLVPEYVYMNHKLFYFCPVCNKAYWEGTHIKNMEESIKELCN